jgi:hypothetical protein
VGLPCPRAADLASGHIKRARLVAGALVVDAEPISDSLARFPPWPPLWPHRARERISGQA